MLEFLVPVDTNGVLTLPSSALDYCESAVVLSCGKDKSITAYRPQQWQFLVSQLKNELSPERLRYLRLLINSAVQVDTSNGTLQIPPYLLQYSGIRSHARLLLSDDSLSIAPPAGE